jgi:hypothetical protein
VLLDDVPDVSTKHLSSAIQLDDIDDIPTPAPTHGTRERRGTAPGHTPAPPSGRRSARMMTQTTDPDGQSLLEDIAVHVEIPADTMPSLPMAADTQPSIPVTPRVSEPVVRFHRTIPPPLGQPVKPVQTRPGHSPARALTQSPVEVDDAASTLTRDSRPKLKAPKPAAKVRPQSGPSRTWILVAGLFAAGAIATAVTLFVTRGDDTVVTTPEPSPAPKPVRPKTLGTVKFNLEPPDAEVWIEGNLVHSGSPWMTQLEAGAYQIQIQRTGYSAWLTSLELSAAETQVLRVVLEPLASEANVAEATLKVTSTPPGLEAVLDGVVLPQKTPLNMPLAVGAHSIVLRQNGVEVWKQDLVAQADVDYEFSPSMDAAKQRERDLRRREPSPAAKPPAEEAKPITAPALPPPPPPVDAAVATPPTPVAPAPDASAAVAPPAPAIVAAKPAPVAATKPVAAVATPAPTTAMPPTGPARTITVAPSAVTRISGSAPEISQHKHADVPASVASKVCISHTGRVTSVAVITKLDSRVAADITRALEAWQYAPYKLNGTPTAACFVVSFKLK